jgi:vitamin B12 transporter
VAASFFDQRFRDMIQYAFISPEQPNYFNVASATARGLELEASARLSSSMTLGATTTLLRTRIEEAGVQEGSDATFVEGKRLLRRPGVMSTVSLQYDVTGNTTGGLFLMWTGERDDRDFATFPATPLVLPAWTRLDVAVTQRLGRWTGGQFEVMARVENVLGADFEEIVNYPAAGRSLTIGLRAARLRR